MRIGGGGWRMLRRRRPDSSSGRCSHSECSRSKYRQELTLESLQPYVVERCNPNPNPGAVAEGATHTVTWLSPLPGAMAEGASWSVGAVEAGEGGGVVAQPGAGAAGLGAQATAAAAAAAAAVTAAAAAVTAAAAAQAAEACCGCGGGGGDHLGVGEAAAWGGVPILTTAVLTMAAYTYYGYTYYGRLYLLWPPTLTMATLAMANPSKAVPAHTHHGTYPPWLSHALLRCAGCCCPLRTTQNPHPHPIPHPIPHQVRRLLLSSTHYAALGVARGASAADVRQASYMHMSK